MLRLVALRSQQCRGKRCPTDTRRPCRKLCPQSRRSPWIHTPTNPALLTYYSLCGAPLVPDAVLLALRPYRPYRVALARGTLASPCGCAAFHRSGNNSLVLAVPRSMCVMTLSKYLPTSRSILSALVTSDIKAAFRTLARRDPMNNQFLRPTAIRFINRST
jgi:hypothetical protein